MSFAHHDGYCTWCQWDMWDDPESGMHPECEVKWGRRKALTPHIEALLREQTDGHRPQQVVDIALLIEQYLDTHTGEDHGS